MAIGDSRSLEADEFASSVAAAKTTSKVFGATCIWCGRSMHDRSKCPDRNSKCSKCGKDGHWIAVCKSKSGMSVSSKSASAINLPADHSDESDDNVMSSAVLLAAIHSKKSSVNGSIPGMLEGHQVQCLIDLGSDLSFVASSFLHQCGLQYIRGDSPVVKLADNSTTNMILGQFTGVLVLNHLRYDVCLSVVGSLVAPVLVGRDLMRLHSSIELSFGGNLPPAKFNVAAMTTLQCKLYDIVPGVEISHLVPLTTQSHRFVRHSEFIKTEVSRLLKEGIIHESQSPWRAQCFVVNYSKKPRMVVDYSNTINRYTPLDSYPIPRIEDILNKVGRYTHFSRIDLKSAYHQVPLKAGDYKLTAFEAGKLYEFSRLAFGLTNAVSIFQRNMDNFIEENHLTETDAYLDDILIGGFTKEQHDKNLDAFLSAAAAARMTFNKEKCQFGVTEIAFLGHVIGGGKLKPDPSRFASLQNYPLPTNEKELRRLLGFFAYYAKWIPKAGTCTARGPPGPAMCVGSGGRTS